MRRRSFLVVVCALAVLGPASIPAGAQSSQQLDQVQEELREAREKVAAAQEEKQGILAAIERSDRRRDELASKVQALTGDLAVAESRLGQIQASLDVTRNQLVRWDRKLGRTKTQLAEQRDTLGGRAAAAYMLGPAGILEVVLGASDLRSLTDRVTYVRSVIGSDNTLLAGIEVTRQTVKGQEARIADFEVLLTGEEERLQAEVDRVAAMRAEQVALQGAVEEEIANREALLADVETERKKWVAAVEELEARSAEIAAQIQSGGSTGSGNPNARLFHPAPGPITSGFGMRVHPIFGTERLHAGVDIDADCGDPIWSAESGEVLSAGYSGGYGIATVVDHGDGLSTLYAHQSDTSVSAGTVVDRGQRIGTVGTTGWSTGCHLHFEVRINGNPVDPAPYLS